MKIPFLKPGDTIALAAPARKATPADYEPFRDFLLQKGYRVKLASNLDKAHHQFAGTDTERALALNEIFDDPEIKAIIMVRGGYGAARIVDLVNWDLFKRNPKWLCGFSDITVFLNHIQAQCGLPTVHSDMAVHFSDEAYRPNFDLLMNLLEGEKSSISAEPHFLNQQGEAAGILVGGNLSVLYSMLGSVSFPDMSGKILFIEDLDEYLYHIDRMMLALERAGVFEKVKAVVVGSMSDMRDNEVSFGINAYEIVSSHLKKYAVPVMFGFPAGHTKTNKPFFVGAETRVVVDKKWSVVVSLFDNYLLLNTP